MNPEAQDYLNTLLAKDPNDLSKDEVDFMRARRSYLKPLQLEEYEVVLKLNQTSKAETVKPANAKSR